MLNIIISEMMQLFTIKDTMSEVSGDRQYSRVT